MMTSKAGQAKRAGLLPARKTVTTSNFAAEFPELGRWFV